MRRTYYTVAWMSAFLAVSSLGAVPAMAQEVIFTGEKCPLMLITDVTAYESAVAAEATAIAEADVAAAADAVAMADAAAVVAAAEAEEGDNTDASEEAEAANGSAGVRNIQVESIDVFGIVNDTYISVLYGKGKTGLVLTEEVAEKIPALKLEELPFVNDWNDIGVGSGGERAMQVQQALSDAKLLEGGVDGAFGSGTETSVKAFQKKAGLEETGVVDAATWFLLMRGAGDGAAADAGTALTEPLTTPYPPVYKVEDKFSAIYTDVEDPLQLELYLDPVWKFTYDVFDGQGQINYTREGIYLGEIVTDGQYIDRLYLNADMHVEVVRGEGNIVSVIPVLEVQTTGSYRPYIQGATLKHGMAVYELEAIYSEGGLSGLDSTESTLLEIPGEVNDLIAAPSEPDDLVLRIHGLHRDYDMDITPQLEEVRAFCAPITTE